MTYQLLGKQVVLVLEKQELKTKSGIILSSDAEASKDKNIGVITQLGLECSRVIRDMSGEKRKFVVGDRVLIKPHQITTIDFEGEKHVMIDEDFIVALVYE